MKKKSIDRLHSQEDTSISILHFLTTDTNPDIEIKNLIAGRNISIEIDRFIHRSPDYQKLLAKIQANRLITGQASEIGFSDASDKSQYLADLNRLENHFKRDVLELANVFLKLSVTSERLIQARHLFEKGHFKEASDLLNPIDLKLDQDHLFILADYWENRKEDSKHGL